MLTSSSFKHWYLLCIAALFLPGCSDILEEELDEEQVRLKLPADALVTSLQTQTFWWEALDKNVEGYQIRIVTPSFTAPVQLIADEKVKADVLKYEMALPPGTYEWSVTAFNSTSTTAPAIRKLVVVRDSTGDLSKQIVVLQLPENGWLTNTTSKVKFTWDAISGAENYRFQLASPDFTEDANITYETTLTTTSLEYAVQEGNFQWRVQALNNQSSTPYRTRSFSIDRTAPVAPYDLLPAQGALVTLPVALTWKPDPSSLRDTLYVYTDSLVTAPVLKIPLTATTYSFNQTDFQQYFWRLRSVDAAGNTGPYSVTRRFRIQ